MANTLYLMGFLNNTLPEGPHVYDPDNLHVTILGEFAIKDSKVNEWANRLNRLNKWYEPFTLKLDRIEYYGKNQDIPVATLQPNDSLQNYHESVVRLVEEVSGKLKEPEYVGEKFSPHISYYPEDQLGYSVKLDQVSLIEHVGVFGTNVHLLKNFKIGVS